MISFQAFLACPWLEGHSLLEKKVLHPHPIKHQKYLYLKQHLDPFQKENQRRPKRNQSNINFIKKNPQRIILNGEKKYMFESASAVPAPRVFSECLSRAICKFFPNCLCVLVRSELLFVCVHHELSFGVKKPSLVSSVAHVFQLSWLHMCACVLLHALYPPSVVISALCETGTLPRCTLTQLIYFASQSCRQFRLY